MSDIRIARSSSIESGKRIRLAFASGVRAYSACSPSNAPVSAGPPKNAVPARAARIRDVALRGVAGAAMRAAAACDGRRDQHAVAAFQIAHVASDRLDDADALMAQNRARLHAAERAAHHVQIGAADRAGRQAHDRVGRLRELRVGHRIDADIADAVKYHCFHVRPSLSKVGTVRGPSHCSSKARACCARGQRSGVMQVKRRSRRTDSAVYRRHRGGARRRLPSDGRGGSGRVAVVTRIPVFHAMRRFVGDGLEREATFGQRLFRMERLRDTRHASA
jgi:hypothetical protein